MDNRIKKLTKSQRIALSRLVSDLIMADKIIDDKEIEKYFELFGESCHRELFFLAQRISFASALKQFIMPYDSNDIINAQNRIIRNINANITNQIINEIANCDGYCAPNEAAILLAIKSFLKWNNDTYTKFDIQSFLLTDLFIGKRFIFYADMSNSAKSLIIENNYELICNLLSSIGFQFIYIPKIVEQFERRGLKKFEIMSMYIFPDIPQNRVKNVYETIIHMTTKTFISKYLQTKLGFDIICPEPALYAMISRSSVLGNNLSQKGLAYDTYANFLKITIGKENILDIISQFVTNYNNIVSYNMHIDFNPSREKLLYHGFHKAFFRLVALAKDDPKKCDINIDTTKGAIFINDKKVQLPLGIAAIYVTIIYYSLFGEKKGLPNKKTYDMLNKNDQDKIQRVYESICSLMNHNSTPTGRASLYNTLQIRISKIRTVLVAVAPNSVADRLRINGGEYLKINIPSDFVMINKVPITKEPTWNNLL